MNQGARPAQPSRPERSGRSSFAITSPLCGCAKLIYQSAAVLFGLARLKAKSRPQGEPAPRPVVPLGPAKNPGNPGGQGACFAGILPWDWQVSCRCLKGSETGRRVNIPALCGFLQPARDLGQALPALGRIFTIPAFRYCPPWAHP